MGHPDLIILPGTKNTMEDLLWLRQSGMEAVILKAAAADTPVLGVCGGYQMLGCTLRDPNGTEGGTPGRVLRGLGLLPIDTTFTEEKTRTRVQATVLPDSLAGAQLDGYEDRKELADRLGITKNQLSGRRQSAIKRLKRLLRADVYYERHRCDVV